MILLNDFKADSEELIQAQLKACEKVLRSGWYILGKEGEKFEEEFAKISASKYSVGVANGMDAIEIGIRCLDLEPGSEIITTSMTAFPTVLAIFRAGLVPVLADIDPETGLMSLESAERCISKKTKAILLVHLYGQIKYMDKWQALCSSHNITLMEDCAQSHLAAWEGRTAGNYGVFGAYSFYPTKNLGCIGDGGAIVTNDTNICELSKCLRNYGQTVRYSHPHVGLNSRLDEIQAAMLIERMKLLTPSTERRKEIAEFYFSNLKNPAFELLAKPIHSSNHVYHLFVIRCKEREKLVNHLGKNEVQTLIHYPIPIHHQKPCASLRKDPNGLKNSEAHANVCLTIPCAPHLSDEDLGKVVEGLNSFR